MGVAYPPEERERIILHVLTELAGGRAVSRILREDDEMPDRSTFWLWCFTDDELSTKVTRAREHGAESILDETIEIADDGTNDWVERQREDGSTYEALNGEHVKRSMLRVTTRIKYAQMIAPRKYGNKLEHSGPGGGPIPVAAITGSMTPDQAADLYAQTKDAV